MTNVLNFTMSRLKIGTWEVGQQWVADGSNLLVDERRECSRNGPKVGLPSDSSQESGWINRRDRVDAERIGCRCNRLVRTNSQSKCSCSTSDLIDIGRKAERCPFCDWVECNRLRVRHDIIIWTNGVLSQYQRVKRRIDHCGVGRSARRDGCVRELAIVEQLAIVEVDLDIFVSLRQGTIARAVDGLWDNRDDFGAELQIEVIRIAIRLVASRLQSESLQILNGTGHCQTQHFNPIQIVRKRLRKTCNNDEVAFPKILKRRLNRQVRQW